MQIGHERLYVRHFRILYHEIEDINTIIDPCISLARSYGWKI
jgi:hypothetical protein